MRDAVIAAVPGVQDAQAAFAAGIIRGRSRHDTGRIAHVGRRYAIHGGAVRHGIQYGEVGAAFQSVAGCPTLDGQDLRPFAVGSFDRINVARIVDHSVQCHFAFRSIGLVFFKTGIGEKLCGDIEKLLLFFFEVYGFDEDFVSDSFDGYTRFMFHSDRCGQFIPVSPNRDLGLLLLSAIIIEVGTARVVFHLSGGKSVALDEYTERIGHAVVHVAAECGRGALPVDGSHFREDRCSVWQEDVFQGAGRFSEIVAQQ